MWYGEYNHALDEKDRFILPAKFRDKIKLLECKKFYMTRGLDGCLFIYDEKTWGLVEEKFRALSFTKKEARAFNRMFFSGAQEIEFDNQGRAVIPEYLKKFAGIEKELVIIGVTDRIEIWAKQCWVSFYGGNQKKFEDMAENLFE